MFEVSDAMPLEGYLSLLEALHSFGIASALIKLKSPEGGY